MDKPGTIKLEPEIVLPEIERVIEETPKHTDKIKILKEIYSQNVIID